MNTGFLTLFGDHVFQSTLCVGVAGLLTMGLQKNRARVRHWVWLAASFKFLIPLSLLIALGSHIPWRTAHTTPESNLSLVVDEVSRPFTIRSVSLPLTAVVPSPASRLPAVLWSIWACGVIGITCSWMVRWRRIRIAARAGSVVQVSIPIPVKSSPTLLEPGVFGVFRPVLVVPEGVFERLPPPQIEAIIAHELCHVRHRDNLFAAIHMFVETVFWFYPLVWWIGKRMVAERERACDEEVLRLGSEPRVYAEAILNVCKLYVESPLVCVPGVSGSNLKQRVQAILADRTVQRMSFASKAALVAAGTAALIAPLLIGMMNATPVQAQSVTEPVPKFEAAAIQPCNAVGDLHRREGDSSAGKLSTGCDFLADNNQLGLIQRAYVKFAGGRDNPFRILPIEGGPEWIRSEGYKIDAVAEGHPSLEMIQGPMLQALLEERFKLKIHHAVKAGPVYSLTLAQGGSKLKPFQEGSCIKVASLPASPPGPGQRYCDDIISARNPASINLEGITVNEFCQYLDLVLDRQVIDNTGMTGKYDFHLSFSRDEFTSRLPALIGGLAPQDPTSPTIFAAVQEQLGLKLGPTTGPVEILHIDHVERLSEN